MSCKQDETRLPCRCEDAASRPAPANAPVVDRRLARMEVLTHGDARLDAVVEGWDGDRLWVRVGGSRIPLRWLQVDGQCGFALPSGRVVVPNVGPPGHATEVLVGSRSLLVVPARAGLRKAASTPDRRTEVAARMDGRVVRVLVRPGERVEAGQPLLILEAMKMEDAIRAPSGGVVREIRTGEGDRVRRERPLVVLDPDVDSR